MPGTGVCPQPACALSPLCFEGPQSQHPYLLCLAIWSLFLKTWTVVLTTLALSANSIAEFISFFPASLNVFVSGFGILKQPVVLFFLKVGKMTQHECVCLFLEYVCEGG